MSLDVYLYSREVAVVKEICPCCGNVDEEEKQEQYYTSNITHNLGGMAEKAGIYLPLWRPEEIGIDQASQLISLLKEGLEKLKGDPKRFKKFNPSNGWGNYDNLVEFVEDYLEACENYPEAEVLAYR